MSVFRHFLQCGQKDMKEEAGPKSGVGVCVFVAAQTEGRKKSLKEFCCLPVIHGI